jgi:hypothetical protein
MLFCQAETASFTIFFIFYAPGLKPPALAGKLSAVEKTGKLG